MIQQATQQTANEAPMTQFGQRSDAMHKGGRSLQQTAEWTATHHHNDITSWAAGCSPSAPSASSVLSTTPWNLDLINHDEALGPDGSWLESVYTFVWTEGSWMMIVDFDDFFHL